MSAASSVNQLSLEAEVGSSSLRTFLELSWPILEPEKPFIGGWHIDATCEHLQAAVQFQLPKLLICMPPRTTKSLQVSVAMPSFAWTRWPELRFLFGSYSSGLSTEHAVLSRRVLDSGWFQARWGPDSWWARKGRPSFKLTTDQNVKTNYENSRRGYRISTSVDGTATGRGADILVGDDLHNLSEIYSETEREGTVTFYRNVWSNRVNTPTRCARILTMQRGHLRDVAGWAREAGYACLILPMEYEKRLTIDFPKAVPSVGPRDPRTKDGEPLCPKRFPKEVVSDYKATLLDPDYRAQYQQDPQPEGGAMFRREWFEGKIVSSLPKDREIVRLVRFWDMASTEVSKRSKDPDWTVGTKMALLDNQDVLVMDVHRGRWNPTDVDAEVKMVARVDGSDVEIREEEEGGSAGKAVTASRRLDFTDADGSTDYAGIKSTGDKKARAKPLAIRAKNGKVWLLKGTWTADWLNEVCLFPGGAHDDQVDSASGAHNDLTLRGGVTVVKVRS